MAKTIMEFIVVVLAGLVTAVALGALLAYPEMLLWNKCLVPAAPMLQPITWLQAWGIAALCAFLFKDSSASPNSALKEITDGIKESNRIAAINSQNVADAANEARQAYSDARDDAKEVADAIRERGS